MKRLWVKTCTTLLFLAVGLFVALVWFNWSEPVHVLKDDPHAVEVYVGFGRRLATTPGELMAGTFVFGAIIGVLALWLTIGVYHELWRDTLDQLQLDKRRLAAANRALEAALPVLREGYDEAIGGLDPRAEAYATPATTPGGDTISIDQLAVEDAEAKRQARREAHAPDGA